MNEQISIDFGEVGEGKKEDPYGGGDSEENGSTQTSQGKTLAKKRDWSPLTGKRFNRLFVVSLGDPYVNLNGKHFKRWECICDCGNTALVRGEALKNGTTKSCGCLNDEARRTKKERPTRDQVIEKMWKNVDKNGPIIRPELGPCWIWTKAKNGKRLQNYGIMWAGMVKYKTHRLALESRIGILHKGVMACHKCDNPPCCNPDHLFPGTAMDNTTDCKEKGRQRFERGTDRYNVKLNETAVRDIRKFSEYGIAKTDLARRFGVVESMIHAIVIRKRWKHVP